MKHVWRATRLYPFHAFSLSRTWGEVLPQEEPSSPTSRKQDCLLLAQLGNQSPHAECPLLGDERKTSARSESVLTPEADFGESKSCRDSWPCLDRGRYDSSHGRYHRAAVESCRRGYAEAAFILVFCAPDAGVCRKLSFWGGLPDREVLHQDSPGCAHSHTTARPQTGPPVRVSIWFFPSMGYQLDCPASKAI